MAKLALQEGHSGACLGESVDEEGLSLGCSCRAERVEQFCQIVPIDLCRVPSKRLEFFGNWAHLHNAVGMSLGLKIVSINDHAEVIEPEAASGKCSLPRLALPAVPRRRAQRKRELPILAGAGKPPSRLPQTTPVPGSHRSLRWFPFAPMHSLQAPNRRACRSRALI